MSDSGGLPDLSGILARVTENPQAMSMLSSLLGGAGESPKKENDSEESKQEKEDAAPVFMPKHGRGGKHEDKRRLLLALKPFLSPERQRALDMLLPLLEAITLFMPGKEPPCT